MSKFKMPPLSVVDGFNSYRVILRDLYDVQPWTKDILKVLDAQEGVHQVPDEYVGRIFVGDGDVSEQLRDYMVYASVRSETISKVLLIPIGLIGSDELSWFNRVETIKPSEITQVIQFGFSDSRAKRIKDSKEPKWSVKRCKHPLDEFYELSQFERMEYIDRCLRLFGV